MKFGSLPTLQAVVRRGNFAAAAQELGLTPSAISQQMRQLEDHFGQPLFDRSGRAVQPTPFAREVLATVEQALDGLQALRDRSRIEVRGRLRLGVINSVQLSTLPAILRTAEQRYPQLQVVLEPVNSSESLLDALKAGDIDTAVVVHPQVGVSRKLVWELLHEEPFVLLYPASYAGSEGMRQIVGAMPWVRYNVQLEGGRLASRFVRKLTPGLPARYEVMTTDAVVVMVAEGLGFSVVPQPRAVTLDVHPVKMLRLDRQLQSRSIILARRAADVDNRRIDALTACMKEVYSALPKSHRRPERR